MSSKRTKNQTKAPTTHDSSDLFHVDNVPSHAKFSQSKDMLYVFEDNEAVIKMIVKGRSPTMRHVSRTHRVALDWLFDRINLEPKIQIRYIDTKHQIADILTKGKFTRDAWNILLLLFNITHFSSLCCAKNISMISCTKRRAKRMQEQKEENRVVANLAVSVSTSSSSVNSPIASRSPKLQVDRLDSQGDISTRRLVAADKDQEYLNHQERISTGEPVAPRYQGYPENPQTPEDSEKSEPESRTWPHHFRISPHCADHMKKVFSIIRKTHDRKQTDDLKHLDVNTAIWSIYVSVTLQAAVSELFSTTLRSDNVQEFDTRWDEFLLSMTRIPPDDILEGLY